MHRLILLLGTAFTFIQSAGQVPQYWNSQQAWNRMNTHVTTFDATFSNYKTKYFVQKKDSSGILIKSRIYRTAEGKYYLSEKEEGDSLNRIYANQTIKISFQDARNAEMIEGIATDTCWLFKIVSGKISMYSCYPPADELTNRWVSAFRVNDEPIQIMDIDKLRTALEGNKKALDKLNNKNYWQNNWIKAVEKFNSQ